MVVIASRGSVFSLEIGTVFTPIAQCLSIEGPEAETETTEADYLDNASAGIPKISTERTEPGSVSLDLFFDPILASHQALTDLLTAPSGFPVSAKITWSDAATTEWPFDIAGVSFGPSAGLSDPLKAGVKLTLADLVTYPT